MICIDIGSGYNPKKGYLTCDSKSYCDFFSIEEIPSDYADLIYIRNTIHHVKDIKSFKNNLIRILKYNSILKIIDVNKKYFNKNLNLDILYYRIINKRYDIHINRTYLDIIKEFNSDKLKLIKYTTNKEKDYFSFIKK